MPLSHSRWPSRHQGQPDLGAGTRSNRVPGTTIAWKYRHFRVSPSLTVGEAEVDEALAVLTEACAQLES